MGDATIGACPICAGDMTRSAMCEGCGPDAVILSEIENAAARLRAESVGAARRGEWQAAYDRAAASLELCATNNDVAAFVLALAAYHGARGRRGPWPAPRREKLPREAADLYDRVAKAFADARVLAKRIAASQGGADAALALLQKAHPGLTVPLPGNYDGAGITLRRRVWLARREMGVALLVAVTAIVAFSIQFFRTAESSVEERLENAGEGGVSIARQGKQIADEERDGEQRALLAQAAALEGDWGTAWQMIKPDGERRVSDPVRQSIERLLEVRGAREAWKRGATESRHGRYAQAIPWLEAALAGRPDDYWRDDAMYLLARSYARTGQAKEAAAAYVRLLEMPSQRNATPPAYLDHARRFLERQGPSAEPNP